MARGKTAEECREMGKKTQFTKETAKDNQAKGVEAKAHKRNMREWAQIIGKLETKVVCPDGSLLDGADLDADVVMQQYRKAHEGNTKAANFIASLKGEMEINIKAEQTIVDLPATKEESKRFLLKLNKE